MVESQRTPEKSDSGAAIIEFAIIVPLILFFIVEIVDLGNVLYNHSALTIAAREVGRLASVTSGLESGIFTLVVNVNGTSPATQVSCSGTTGGSFSPAACSGMRIRNQLAAEITTAIDEWADREKIAIQNDTVTVELQHDIGGGMLADDVQVNVSIIYDGFFPPFANFRVGAEATVPHL